MTNKDVLLNKIKDEAIKINSVEEFNDFCVELKDSSYQYYDNDMKNIIIPNIIEKLAKSVDIKNELYKWEEIITLLYMHFMDDFMEISLNKLYNYYSNYPFECLFELVLYHYYDNGDDIPLWYNSINKIYTQFYIDKIDKELFDKYILFAYDDSRYFIALLYKNDFKIPKNSIYLNIEKLLEKRFAYYGSMRNEMLAQYGLLIKDIRNINIDSLDVINCYDSQKIIEIYPDEIEETVLLEGAKKQIIVNAYERNPKAREKCINKYGFNCFICGFNFQKTYGEMGKEFIHVHHLKPLSEIQEEYEVNPVEDLRPVCPNCHAMLHRKVPTYSIEEIKNILKGQN